MKPREITVHEISFPRFVESIASGKRTLAHLIALHAHIEPAGEERKASAMSEFAVGDVLLLCPRGARGQRRRIVATVSKIDLCPLDVTEADCALLDVASVADYVGHWDRLHPDLAVALRPIVWRIEWSYDVIFEPRPRFDLDTDPAHRFSLTTIAREAVDAVSMITDRAKDSKEK